MFLPQLIAQDVENLVFTEDFNQNGRVCLSGNCLSSADVAYIQTQRQNLTVSFRTVTNSSNFLYVESPTTNNYTIKRMPGSTTPANFSFTPVAQKLISNVGCYLISGSTLVLERNNGNLSPEECYETAARQGDLYFALQQYGRCSSGNSTNYGVNGLNLMTTCMYSCTLNSATSTLQTTMTCGDNTAAAVYQISHAAIQSITSNSITNGTLVFAWPLLPLRLISQVQLVTNSGIAATFNATLGFPPAVLTSTTTVFSAANASYGFGSYVISASSTLDGSTAPTSAFDFNLATNWHSTGGVYNSTTGVYKGAASTTNSNGTVHAGEWLQIRVPSAISLEAFTITPRQDQNLFLNRSPRNFVLLGSNDGTSWQTVYWAVNVAFTSAATRSFSSIFNRNTFSYFRLSVQRVGNVDSGTLQDSVQVASFELHVSSIGSDSSSFITSSVEYPGAVRIESFKYPGYYLRSLNNTVLFRKDFANDTSFKNDSAFYPSIGLGGNLVTILWVNTPLSIGWQMTRSINYQNILLYSYCVFAYKRG